MASSVEELISEKISEAKSKDDVINHLRGGSESERHWISRKQFLCKNWEDFTDETRERLECLSQCWAGLHFLGVGYPMKVLEKVREMSYGLPNMSEMLQSADREIHLKEVARRRAVESNTKGPITADTHTNRKRPATGSFELINPKRAASDLELPQPLKPSAKQIGLFLNLSSYCRKQGEDADLIKCISLQKQRVSFLSEEVCTEQLEDMEKFYDKSINGCDEVVEINIIGVFVTQATASTREEAKSLAIEQAIKILQKTPLVVVSGHRRTPKGKIISELCVSNSRGAKALGEIPPKLKTPEIMLEPR